MTGIGGSAGDQGGLVGAGADAAGTGTAGSTQENLSFVVQPSFVGNSNSAVPQAGVLRLQTNVSASLFVTISGGNETWTLTLPAATVFQKPIIGVKPGTTYQATLAASAGMAMITAGPIEWTSPSLPASFPPITVATSQPAQMEPGMTLFDIRVAGGSHADPAVIVDHQGVVRWYYLGDSISDDLRRLPNGDFLFASSECVLEQIDVLGNTVRSWQATKYPKTCNAPANSIPVAIDSFHHEASMLPNGNLLVLSTELRTISNYPTSDTDPSAPPKTTSVVTCVIVEFSPDGQILKYIPINDLLDPTRIGRGVFDHGWALNRAYDTQTEQAAEWDHANAVVYDQASDSYYVSLRYQDAVIKVNRRDQTLSWILGTPSNWKQPFSDKLLTPVGSNWVWPYHQHSVELSSKGLIMYDNGNYRASAYEPAQNEWSRALIVSVDEQAKTVSQVWSYGAPSGSDSFFSAALGDADLQPTTGNVLLVNSRLATRTGVRAQILEVMFDGTRVFELSVCSEVTKGVCTVYRADRIADVRQ
jgi:arylsulfate sulfotransferase